MRWPMVGSGTRNALAISRVVRPPTARSVSGMADAGESDGWQHMNMRISVSSWPCASPGSASDLDRPLGRLHVDHPVAGEQLLRFRERSVSDHGRARPVGHDELGLLRAGKALGVDQLAALGELLVQGLLESNMGRDVLGLPLGHRDRTAFGLLVLLQQHELHRSILPVRAPRRRLYPGVRAADAFSTLQGGNLLSSGPLALVHELALDGHATARIASSMLLGGEHVLGMRERLPPPELSVESSLGQSEAGGESAGLDVHQPRIARANR